MSIYTDMMKYDVFDKVLIPSDITQEYYKLTPTEAREFKKIATIESKIGGKIELGISFAVIRTGMGSLTPEEEINITDNKGNVIAQYTTKNGKTITEELSIKPFDKINIMFKNKYPRIDVTNLYGISSISLHYSVEKKEKYLTFNIE